MTITRKPHIAVIMEDALAAIGLKGLLENIIPFAQVDVWHSLQEMKAEGKDGVYHYFISPEQVMTHADFFRSVMRQTIVLGTKDKMTGTTKGFRFIRSDAGLHELTKSLLMMQQSTHKHYAHYPEPLGSELIQEDKRIADTLTRREIEILKMIARGKSSKEISSELHISLYPLNTQRKNIMDKLDAHAATKLVAYAVNHGYINPEEM